MADVDVTFPMSGPAPPQEPQTERGFLADVTFAMRGRGVAAHGGLPAAVCLAVATLAVASALDCGLPAASGAATVDTGEERTVVVAAGLPAGQAVAAAQVAVDVAVDAGLPAGGCAATTALALDAAAVAGLPAGIAAAAAAVECAGSIAAGLPAGVGACSGSVALDAQVGSGLPAGVCAAAVDTSGDRVVTVAGGISAGEASCTCTVGLACQAAAGLPAGQGTVAATVAVATSVDAGLPAGTSAASASVTIDAEADAGLPAGAGAAAADVALQAALGGGLPAAASAATGSLTLDASVVSGLPAGSCAASITMDSGAADFAGAVSAALAYYAWDVTDVGGKVSVCPDQVTGGSPYDIVQGTDGNRPLTYASDSAFGGYNTISGNDAATWLQNTETGSVSQPYTVIIASIYSSLSSGFTIFDGNSSTNRCQWLWSNSSVTHKCYTGANFSVCGGAQISHGAIDIIEVNGASSTHEQWEADGTTYGPTAMSANPGSWPRTGVTVGNKYDGSQNSYMRWAFCLTVDGQVSSSELSDLSDLVDAEFGWSTEY